MPRPKVCSHLDCLQLQEEEADEVAERLLQLALAAEDSGVALAREPLLPSFDLAGIAQLITSGRVERIVCMCGAGISVSAGEHRAA
jgi:hypothetical protein